MNFSTILALAALVQAPKVAPHATPHAPAAQATPAPSNSPTPFRDAQSAGPGSERHVGAPTNAGTSGAPGAASAPDGAPNTDAPAPPPVEPWTGTLAEGLAEVRRLVDSKDPEAARALCERLVAPNAMLRWKERALASGGAERALARVAEPVFDALGVESLSAPARAEVRYASGVAATHAGDGRAADDAFGSALALAGPGELRLDSGYQLATVALLEAEAARLQIPELREKLGGPNGAPAPQQPAPPAANAQPGDPAAPDPIQVARALYLRARERFVERLRADWRDADARANTELVLKRLKELDELEKKREEQKQKDPKQNPDPKQQNDSKDPKDPQQKEQDPKDSKPKDGQDSKDPKPDEKPQEPEKPEDSKDPKDAQKKDAAPQPGEERELTKEEMTRLLDVLKQREQQWKKLQQQLHQARRAKVKKDW